MRKKVLVLTGHYLPSLKAGGPVQSIKNLVDILSSEFDFYIITSDRDLGDKKPFDNISNDNWIQTENVKVFYTNTLELTFKKISNIINNIEYDIMYLNSFFSYKYSIAPLLLQGMHIIRNKPVVLAPRGEFSPGAIGLKIFKKKIYINLAKALGLYKDVRWHATSKEEKKDIEDLFGKVKEIVIANNLTADYKNLNYEKSIKKTRGNLKLIYISRIHPKKNLKMGIDLLRHVKGNVEFNIFGPIENSVYWTKCKRAIDSLPENIKVSYNGVVEHVNIVDVFKGQHVLLFPTLGENFGHVISEALIGGCPVIISDQTPWKHLEQEQVGWEIKLNNREKFIATIQKCINLDNGEYQLLSKNAFNYAKRISNNQQEIKKYRDLFLSI